MSIPRPEYPRPQFTRSRWLNLNGPWQFEVDQGDSGHQRGLLHRELSDMILVPFCPESSLSGVEHVDFLHAVWYRRTVDIPADWAGSRVLLHFGAVDYDATVWVNGREVARHRGGFTPFSCDLGGIASPGESATIVVRAREPHGEGRPGGKQSNFHYHNAGCDYTRTTGIWQTVWMEPVPEAHLLRPRITPVLASGAFSIEQPIAGPRSAGMSLRLALRDAAGVAVQALVPVDPDLTPVAQLVLPPDRVRLWEPGAPHLYDLDLALLGEGGQVIDQVSSYAGLRAVTVRGPAVWINGKPVFQRLVLDQGFYPDGIMTASSDAALVADIELALAAGFNGARLHQKVFEERFLYHADRLGYLVWGEFGDWGFRNGHLRDARAHQSAGTMMTQWLEALERDYSHPSIIGWCPLNESAERIEDGILTLDDLTRGLFLATKAADRTRPVLDASGYSHRVAEADVYDCHDYDQDPVRFTARHQALAEGKAFLNGPADHPWSIPWHRQPFFVSEFGGIWWNPDPEVQNSWGYGDRPQDIEAFYTRFAGLCQGQLRNSHLFGYCYTQLTDVFQEQNGIYFFDRRPKFDTDRLAAIQGERAAIEHGDDIG